MCSDFNTNAKVTDNKFLSLSPVSLHSPSSVINPHDDDAKEQAEPKNIMEIDDEGFLKIPSPIPIWPKPLALSYQSFLKFYTTLIYKDTERMEAGSRLIASLLEFYFPWGKFQFWRLEYQPKALIQSVPVDGTIYWGVVVDDRGSSAEGIAPESESMVEPVSSDENARVDSAFAPEKNSFVLLVAIVTETKFLNLPERLSPSKLYFSSSASPKRGAVVIDRTDGTEYHHGNVLVLGGTGKPKLLPSWEFYNFDIDRGDGALLTPWFGQLESTPDSFGTNIFSLATPEVEKVDRMFRGIVSTASGDMFINPSTAELLQIAQGQAAKREALKPQSRAVLNTTMTDEYLDGLRVNRSGKLQGFGGRFLSKDKEKEARAVARARGIRFQPCSYHIKSWKEKKEEKLAKENRTSMTPNSRMSMMLEDRMSTTPDIDTMDLENYGTGRDEGYGSA